MLRMRIFSRKCSTKIQKKYTLFLFIYTSGFPCLKDKRAGISKKCTLFLYIIQVVPLLFVHRYLFLHFFLFFCTWKIDDVCAFPHFPWIVETKALYYYGLVKWFYGFLGVEIVFDLYTDGFLIMDCKLCSHCM